MSQLLTLIWLKWRLLRNSLRSSKALVNKAASLLGTLLALALSLAVAVILGFAAYALTRSDVLSDALRHARTHDLPEAASVELIFFSIFGILYLMWATVPLSIGGSKQFDAGKLLMYPITLRKLFAVDFVSELTTLHSVFAVPAVLALCIGAGLGSGNLATTLIIAFPAILFGIALSKWLSTIIGSLVRRKRARGETIVALIGAVAGLGAAAAGQVAPMLVKHADSIRYLRWTPPGAAAFLLTTNAAADQVSYLAAFVALSAYAVALVVATYWLARRAALGLEGKRRRRVSVQPTTVEDYSGWQLPFISAQLSAVLEKELRYAMRNAQVRMMALMPLILILIRFVNSRRWGTTRPPAADDFLAYGSGLLPLGGVLYVFLILAGISCNSFAFEEGGMRTLILSPVDRRKILLGKNISVTLIALVFSTVLLILNTIIFQDLSFRAILFVALSFVVFAAISSTIGNWISIRFPKRMRFGKRLNLSGVAGLLLIPMVILLAAPPLLATVVGYVTRNLLNVYTSLALMGLLSLGLYFVMLNFQGRLLAAREIEILEAVREPADE
jgi:ABC-type transport system involved in multi-copper enzyme maturation permease subunit